MLKRAQLAAFRAGTGVIRFSLRQRGEIVARQNFLSNVLRLGQRFLVGQILLILASMERTIL